MNEKDYEEQDILYMLEMAKKDEAFHRKQMEYYLELIKLYEDRNRRLKK